MAFLSVEKSDSDSVLVIRFEKTKNGAAAYVAHIGVPSYDHKGVTEGWKKYYWEPWKKYLAAKTKRSNANESRSKNYPPPTNCTIS